MIVANLREHARLECFLKEKSADIEDARRLSTWCQQIIGQRRTLEMVGALLLRSDDVRLPPLL